MKRTCLLLFTLVFLAAAAKAQDIIRLTNGTEIQAKVMEINPSDIKYKDFNNPDGPTITIVKSTVASIRYANGTTTVLSSSSADSKPAGGHFVRGSGSGDERKREEKGDGDKYVSFRRKSEKSRIHGWYFGLNMNLGGGYASTSDPDYSTTSGGYFSLNLLATKMFNEHIGIQFGLGAEGWDYGVNFNYNNGNYNSNFSASDVFSLSYYTIPVRAVYFSNSKQRVGFYAMAGFDLSILDHATDNEGDPLENYYRSALISPYISCGVEFRNRHGRAAWMFGPYYKASLNNVYSGNTDVYGFLNSGNSGSVGTIGLSINYMAKFRGQR